MINTEYIFSILPKKEFFEYVNAPNDDVCLEIETERRKNVTDEQTKKIIKKISGCANVTEFQNMDANKRQKTIKKIHNKGVSIRQLNRLTGISKKAIEFAIKQ